MTDGRRGKDLAAVMAPRLRWLAALIIGGAGAVLIANALSGWAMLAASTVLVALWIWVLADGVLTGWHARNVGLPAILPTALPVVALPFAWFLIGHALYWSHVLPSWWLLARERPAFELALRRNTPPPGISAIERDGGRTAFLTANGMLGAWSGIVHDPSGRLAHARGWSGGPVARDVSRTFGSRTIWCQRLDGPWFHCHFD